MTAADPDWKPVDVAAAFTGLRFLPWWLGVATNSAAPKLEIGREAIRYRVLRKSEKPFQDIVLLEVRTMPGTVNLCFDFHDSVFTFAANVRTLDEATRALRLLGGRIPLGERAQALLIG